MVCNLCGLYYGQNKEKHMERNHAVKTRQIVPLSVEEKALIQGRMEARMNAHFIAPNRSSVVPMTLDAEIITTEDNGIRPAQMTDNEIVLSIARLAESMGEQVEILKGVLNVA